MSPSAPALAGKRVLVTGGTGFVGSRLVERLVLAENARARVLVHRPASAARVARLPIEMIAGDVLRSADVERAVAGCEMVFHCAYGTSPDQAQQRRVNVEGTRNVLEACRRAKVTRVIHFSTLMVYGVSADGDLDESAPRRYFGNAYADSKLDAEKLVFDYARRYRLPAVVLQPTAVYGPFALQWTIHVLQKLQTGRVILIDGGDGLRNAVYIDDLVNAALLGAVREEAVGEAFLISGAVPVTWREFYRAFEAMLGLNDRLVDLPAAEAAALYRQAKKKRSALAELRAALVENQELRRRLLGCRELAWAARRLRRLFPGAWRRRLRNRLSANGQVGSPAATPLPLHLLDPAAIRFQTAKTRVRIDKAMHLLGYRPAFDFAHGVEITERWARWANLLDPAPPVLGTRGVQGSRFNVQGSRSQSSC